MIKRRNNISQTYTILILTIQYIFISSMATAQEAGQDTTFKLDEIVISASKIEQPVSKTSRSVSVITRGEIDNGSYTSVGDILARQKGIHMVGAGQTPGSLQSAFVRNADSDQVVVMIDGIRISDPSAVENSMNLAELSVANVERIEVVRGSHSTLFGSSAIGGVVNIITRGRLQPGFHANLNSKGGYFGEGTSTSTQNGFFNYSGENGFYGNLSTFWERTEGINATIDTVSNSVFKTADQDDFDKLDVTGKLGFRQNGWDAYVSYRRLNQDTQVDAGAFSDDDNALADFQRHLFTYGVTRQVSNQLRLRYKGGFSTLDRLNLDDSSLVNTSGDFDGNFSRTATDATLLENEIQAIWKDTHTRFIAGFNSSRQTMNIRTRTVARAFNFVQETDLDSLGPTELINSVYLLASLKGSLISESFSGFTLNVGTRVLHHDQFDTHSTFEINPSFRFDNGTLVFSAITTGFNAPSLFQLESPDRGFGEITALGNDQLDPETSISYEVGVRHQFGNRLNVDFSLYRTNVDQAIEFVNLWNGDTPIDELGFSDFLGDTYVNATEQKISGLEFSLRAQIKPNLVFSGDLAANTSEIQFDGSDLNAGAAEGNHVQVFETGQFVSRGEEVDGLTRRPSVSGNIMVDYYPTPAIRAGIISRFVGSRDDVLFDSALGPFGALNRESLDSYNITSITLGYDVTPRFSLIGKIENLFDSQYQEIRGFQSRDRGYYLTARYSL